MKFTELFPRLMFPLRAKKNVRVPEKKVTVRQSVYFQKPLGDLTDQDWGVCRSIHRGGKILLTYAVRYSKEEENGVFYTVKDGTWVKENPELIAQQEFALLGYSFETHRNFPIPDDYPHFFPWIQF